MTFFSRGYGIAYCIPYKSVSIKIVQRYHQGRVPRQAEITLKIQYVAPKRYIVMDTSVYRQPLLSCIFGIQLRKQLCRQRPCFLLGQCSPWLTIHQKATLGIDIQAYYYRVIAAINSRNQQLWKLIGKTVKYLSIARNGL